MLSNLFCPAADILALVEEQKPSDAGASEALPPTVSCNTWLRKDLEASHEGRLLGCLKNFDTLDEFLRQIGPVYQSQATVSYSTG